MRTAALHCYGTDGLSYATLDTFIQRSAVCFQSTSFCRRCSSSGCSGPANFGQVTA